jgi:hypothetical protein
LLKDPTLPQKVALKQHNLHLDVFEQPAGWLMNPAVSNHLQLTENKPFQNGSARGMIHESHPLGFGREEIEDMSDREAPSPPFSERIRSALGAVKEVVIGLTVHELTVDLRKEKGHLNNLFMLVIFGDLVGLPVLPPFYSMRLLPYVVPQIHRWKRSLLRERDMSDLGTFDL